MNLKTKAYLGLAAMGLLSTASCARHVPTAPEVQRASAGQHALATASAPSRVRAVAEGSCFEGDIGPGAHYLICVPESWNGDLVLYAHGYTAPVFPVGVPPQEVPLAEGLRAMALQAGFAFAYSSYSETGLGLKDAALRTEQLSNLFMSLVGSPARTFLIGASFGGLASLKLVEDHPERYSGLMALCGMVGGVRAEIDYVANVRVLFDHFYEGVLPWGLYELPPNFDIQRDLIGPVVAAISANPQGAVIMSKVSQTPIPYSTPEELVQSIVQALVLEAVEVEDLLDRTHGQEFFDNTATVYTGDLPPELLAELNASVARYSAGPVAKHFLEKYYEPTGDLRIPMVSMHTSMDPVVPVFHEEIYRSRVEAEGRLDHLHQVIVSRYGHLLFTPEEIVGGFQQLVGLAALRRQAVSASR